MAYQTGLANDAADLQSTLETFCQTNGWTLSGGVLSKGLSNIKLTAGDSNREIKIQGANSADFLSGVCAKFGRIWIDTAYWPATYHFFAHTGPDTVVCVVQYNTNYFEWLAFGDAIKHGDYTGGNWFGAVRENFNYGVYLKPTESVINSSGGRSSGALFWNVTISGTYRSCFLHAEIDGYTWPGDNGGTSTPWPSFPQYADPLHQRTPNAWNSQPVLLPFWLFLKRPDTFVSLIAELGHIRALRVDNHNPGDLITLGSDQWMVFPWFLKNSAQRDGPSSSMTSSDLGHTGTFGWAIRYDGP